MYTVNNIRYFEKPGGVDIFAEIFDKDKKVGWIEQAAYQAPQVYFYSEEARTQFKFETGQAADELGWEEYIESLIQDCERKFYGPEEYDRLLKEVLNG